jgi:hypothetical protein
MGNSISKQLSDMERRLMGEITEIKDHLFAKRGDDIAKKVTVSIFHIIQTKKKFASSSSNGHGLVLAHNGKHYILSAAHVLVPLMSAGKIIEVKLQWVTGQAIIVAIKNLFLPETYVTDGYNDIACVQITSKLPETETQAIELCDSNNLVENIVVGHGNMFLKGEVKVVAPSIKRVLVNEFSSWM